MTMKKYTFLVGLFEPETVVVSANTAEDARMKVVEEMDRRHEEQDYEPPVAYAMSVVGVDEDGQQ